MSICQNEAPQQVVNKKRLVFAQEIRNKQRRELKMQYKVNFENQVFLKKLVNNLEHNLETILKYLHENRECEKEFCDLFLHWHQKSNMRLRYKQQLHCFVFFIFLAVQHQPQKMLYLLQRQYKKILSFSIQINQFSYLCYLLYTCLDNYKYVQKDKVQNTKNIVREYAKNFLQQVRLSKLKFSNNQLRFYNKCVQLFPQQFLQFVDHEFMIKILQVLKYQIGDRQKSYILLRLFISLTYYEGTHLQNISEVLIQNNILSDMKFMYSFDEKFDKSYVSILLNNMVICQKHVNEKIPNMLLSQLWSLFDLQSSSLKAQKQSGIQAFLTIMTYIELNEQNRQILREMNIIQILLFMIEKYEQIFSELVLQAFQILDRLFQLDYSYYQKFTHSGGKQIIQKYPTYSQFLYKKYDK